MAKDLRPNWKKWKYIPDVPIWQGVALSMNIDPKHIGRSPEGWLAGEDEILAKSLEFKERLDLVTSNIQKLTVKGLSMESAARHIVTRDSLAALLISFKRKIPATMPKLARAAVPEKPLTPNERNTLLIIIAALCKQLRIDTQERGAAHKIARMVQEIGAEVTEETILDKLKKIPDALETRVK